MQMATVVEPRIDYSPLSRAAGDASASPRSSGTSRVALREILLALTLFLVYGFFQHAPAWNENSRYDLVLALVDDRTTVIDPYHLNTGDKAFFDGHYYSDKAPGSSFLAVPTYALMRAVGGLFDIDYFEPSVVIQAFVFTASTAPTVVLALLLLRFLRAYVDEWWAIAITLAYALGSIAFPFATMYFGHAATTFFLFAAFYLLWRDGSRGSGWRTIAAGFLAGWAVLVDLAALLGVAALLCYALTRGRSAPLLMIIGAIPPAVMLLAYNWISFGGPLSSGYTNLANSTFSAGMSQGLLGVTLPTPAALNEILFGGRGLLRLSLWFGLAPLGLWAARRRAVRAEVALCGLICLAFVVFNAGYYLPIGGASPGPRFLLPALPFAAVLVALAPASRYVTALLAAVSVGLVGLATATIPNANEAATQPLTDIWLPMFVAGRLADTTAWLRWGLPGALPLALLALGIGVAAAAMYATTRAPATARRAAGVGVVGLAALVIFFGLPLDPTGTLKASGGGPRLEAADLAVVHTGVARVRLEDGQPHALAWAQLENRGGLLEATSVMFSVYAPTGEQVWTARHEDVRWFPGERKQLNVGWPMRDAAPGEYRFGIALLTVAPRVSFTSVEDAGRVRVEAVH
jgi:hypothetical protein